MNPSRFLAGLAVLGALLLLPPSGASAAAGSGLRFAQPNGAAIHFAGSPTVRCGQWEPGVRRGTLFVELRNSDRAWQLRAVLADVAAGQRIRFPTSIVDALPHGAVFFVAQRRPLIEASTNEEEASGWLAFSQASCRPGATVSVTVHAVLGSELFEGRKVQVDGTFTGTVAR